MTFQVLAINPGSTSTKIALFAGEEVILKQEISHPREKIATFDSILAQFSFRYELIKETLQTTDLKQLAAVVGRGGLLRPMAGGTYEVNEAMERDLKIGVSGQHASNLGGLLARKIADDHGLPAYIVDPVVVDELAPIARYSGNAHIVRQSIFHALNHKAVARNVAKSLNKEYTTLNLIVAHLGGGISVGAHQQGLVIDVNNALDGDGPMSPERSGSLPMAGFLEWAFSGEMTKEALHNELVGRGGLVSYKGTNDLRDIERQIEAGDQEARALFEAMAYQVAKEIGASAAVLKGKIDVIVLTGGLARSEAFIQEVSQYIHWIAPIMTAPGEDEMAALNGGAQRILQGIEEAKVYLGEE
ncbi:butyrate kinase [Listeria grandensis]|uniref:Probable butyrate kinase n=1 Tax=Listeria grandensis TaxID=1494963 RepID=A0A7X1CNL4_9LIST|nr:butyrate kinase [Listeria grandensis]MBC1935017.1 butyrate kinase [Listeria grandensis]